MSTNPGQGQDLQERLLPWWPEATLALGVLVIGVMEAPGLEIFMARDWTIYAVVVAFAAAVLLARKLPPVGFAIVWLTCALQLATGMPLLMVQASVGIVAFGCARWGSYPVVAISGGSIPLAGVIAVLATDDDTYVHVLGSFGARGILRSLYDVGSSYVLLLGLAGFACLVVPWLLGLLLRATARADASQAGRVAAEEDAEAALRETEQMREIARLRDDQARLARDVHDVVGHSLAVILAQAESAQYLEDPERLKVTLATIAGSARSSLQDVRAVLTAAREEAARGGLEELVAGVSAGRHEVVSSEVGTPQPLPPELELVAYRVLQEMLTNALKHGSRDEPVFVERHWPDGRWEGELRMEVRNVVAGGTPGGDPSGQGLSGMRRRLEAVGGRLIA